VLTARKLCTLRGIFNFRTTFPYRVRPGLTKWFSVAPGAFQDSLARYPVRALLLHDDSRELASTTAGTLRVKEEGGLVCDIDLRDDELGRQVLRDVRARKLVGISPMFTHTETKHMAEGAEHEYESILQARLYEVSVVDIPSERHSTLRILED
jgi:HK97 family phage prohead protease